MDTLLIVEDQPVVRASMARGLAKLPGIEIVNAGTAAEARALIEAMPPSMMISDLDLPDGSGLELLAELDRRGPHIPVIFISAYLRRFRIPQRAGLELLEKPVPLSKLRETVQKRLGASADVGAFGLADYVQLAGMGRRSVRLAMLRNGARVGEVVVREGEAWHAEDQAGEGPEAFARLMREPGLLVEPESGRMPVGKRTLEGSCEHVLLESARRIDEERRGADPVIDEGWDDAEFAEPAAEGVASFDELYERGVEALLDKRYADAFAAFRDARRLQTTPSLEANLHRLEKLGYAS